MSKKKLKKNWSLVRVYNENLEKVSEFILDTQDPFVLQEVLTDEISSRGEGLADALDWNKIRDGSFLGTNCYYDATIHTVYWNQIKQKVYGLLPLESI
jgi:hypothetical protein